MTKRMTQEKLREIARNALETQRDSVEHLKRTRPSESKHIKEAERMLKMMEKEFGEDE